MLCLITCSLTYQKASVSEIYDMIVKWAGLKAFFKVAKFQIMQWLRSDKNILLFRFEQVWSPKNSSMNLKNNWPECVLAACSVLLSCTDELLFHILLLSLSLSLSHSSWWFAAFSRSSIAHCSFPKNTAPLVTAGKRQNTEEALTSHISITCTTAHGCRTSCDPSPFILRHPAACSPVLHHALPSFNLHTLVLTLEHGAIFSSSNSTLPSTLCSPLERWDYVPLSAAETQHSLRY